MRRTFVGRYTHMKFLSAKKKNKANNTEIRSYSSIALRVRIVKSIHLNNDTQANRQE